MFATVRPPRMHHLSAALLLALGSPLAAFAQSQPTAAAASPEARTLDKIEVTGSRIKRTDVEAAMPVTIIQKAEIEAQGITSAEQLLQQLNIASSGPDSLAANSGVAPRAPAATTACPAPTCADRVPTRPWCCSMAAASPRTAWRARWST